MFCRRVFVGLDNFFKSNLSWYNTLWSISKKMKHFFIFLYFYPTNSYPPLPSNSQIEPLSLFLEVAAVLFCFIIQFLSRNKCRELSITWTQTQDYFIISMDLWGRKTEDLVEFSFTDNKKWPVNSLFFFKEKWPIKWIANSLL